jgi:AraC-like DNA-binding protein
LANGSFTGARTDEVTARRLAVATRDLRQQREQGSRNQQGGEGDFTARESRGLRMIRHTSSVIAATSGAVAIGDLSAAAGVSSTHLAQRFKELIGVTPKRLARTYRFAATVFAINPAAPIDWAGLAGGAGYFDQAHFGHEFRAFTGLTPSLAILTSGLGTPALSDSISLTISSRPAAGSRCR